jgi:hypothetical protein
MKRRSGDASENEKTGFEKKKPLASKKALSEVPTTIRLQPQAIT